MNFKLKKNKQKGFTLIELILVLGISALAFISFIEMEQKKAEVEASRNAGDQISELGQALSQYINEEYSNLVTNIPNGTTVTIPLTALQSNTGTTGIFNNRELLPTNYSTSAIFPTPIPINLTLYLTNKNNQMLGLILSDGAITDKTGATRYDWMGVAMKKMGVAGGMSFLTANTLSGLNGSWSIDNTNFANINQAGLVGYRVNYQGSLDNTYLRLDGMYPMNGNLNMGNYNINNATDISYSGWLYGNNGMLNNLVSGTITNAGTITTTGINGKTTSSKTAAINTTNANYTGGNASYANFDLLYTNCINCGVAGESYTAALPNFNAANGDVRISGNGAKGNLFVNDILLGSSTGPISSNNGNAFLSDRLPRYSSRGTLLVNNGMSIAKPTVTTANLSGYVCRWSGTGTAPVPKIQLVPAVQWLQGAVLGPMTLSFAGSQINADNTLTLAGQITQQQYSAGGMAVYSVDNGASWTVYLQTPSYNPAYVGGTALAEVFCDYGA
jgi:prepilin-type N-terminal cleavage/methylation domain-containing protein